MARVTEQAILWKLRSHLQNWGVFILCVQMHTTCVRD